MNRSPFSAQIQSLPALIQQSADRLSLFSERLAIIISEAKISQVILTGCGDSHHAALATRLAMQKFSGMPCRALSAMELARYQAGQLRLDRSGQTLVIGISASGQVSRTIEALELSAMAGAKTIALTGNREGDLAGVADEIYLVSDNEPPCHSSDVIVPGTRSYFLSLLALFHLAIQLGLARQGKLSPILATAVSELESLPELAQHTLAACESSIRKLVTDWSDADRFVFCGSGPNFGTALFSAAKLIEAAGDAAIGQDLEEWAHLQYFESQVDTPTVIISAAQRDFDRALEIATAAATIGRRIALIGPEASIANGILDSEIRLTTAGTVSECLSPLLTALPSLVLADYRAEEKSEPYFRGFGGGRSREGGGGISRIRSSNRQHNIVD